MITILLVAKYYTSKIKSRRAAVILSSCYFFFVRDLDYFSSSQTFFSFPRGVVMVFDKLLSNSVIYTLADLTRLVATS